MAVTIPDLWGDEVRVDILSPLAILRAQAEQLAKRTKGILNVEISGSDGGQQVAHHFEVIAPLFGNYRERLLTAMHDAKKVYPVLVTAEAFAPKGPGQPPYTVPVGNLQANQRLAVTDTEFISLVSEVFRSITVRSLIQSLIAASNEMTRVGGEDPASSAPNGDQ